MWLWFIACAKLKDRDFEEWCPIDLLSQCDCLSESQRICENYLLLLFLEATSCYSEQSMLRWGYWSTALCPLRSRLRQLTFLSVNRDKKQGVCSDSLTDSTTMENTADHCSISRAISVTGGGGGVLTERWDIVLISCGSPTMDSNTSTMMPRWNTAITDEIK